MKIARFLLGGDFKHLLFFTPKRGDMRNDPIWREYFSDWLNPPRLDLMILWELFKPTKLPCLTLRQNLEDAVMEAKALKVGWDIGHRKKDMTYTVWKS